MTREQKAERERLYFKYAAKAEAYREERAKAGVKVEVTLWSDRVADVAARRAE